MRIFNLIILVLCLLFALLQYNDPDPYLWVPIYLYTAVLAWLASRGKYYTLAMYGGILGYAAYAVYLFTVADGVRDWYSHHQMENLVQTMKATKPWIEYTREFGGLIFLMSALTINLIAAHQKQGSKDKKNV